MTASVPPTLMEFRLILIFCAQGFQVSHELGAAVHPFHCGRGLYGQADGVPVTTVAGTRVASLGLLQVEGRGIFGVELDAHGHSYE